MNYFTRLFGILITCFGAIMTFAWIFHFRGIIQIFPQFAPMQFNTAFSFLVLGFCYLTLQSKRWKLSIAFAATAGMIGLLTFSEYILGVNLGIDELLMHCYFPAVPAHPGRMAPNSALSFFLAGFSLILLARPTTDFRKNFFGVFLGTLISTLATLAFLGFFIELPQQYGWGNFASMAIHTAFAFFFVGISIILITRSMVKRSGGTGFSVMPLIGSVAILIITICLLNSALINQAKEIRGVSLAKAEAIKFEIIQSLDQTVKSLERMAARLEFNSRMPQAEWENDAQFYFKHLGIINQMGVIEGNYRLKWSYPPIKDPKIAHYDISKEPIRKETLDRAIALKGTAVSPILNFAQGGRGFVVFSPIFKAGQFSGALGTGFKPSVLFRGIINSTNQYEIEISDGQEVLYSNISTTPDFQHQWNVSTAFELFGHHWYLKVIPTLTLIDASESGIPYAILITGVFIALIFGFMIQLAITSRTQSRTIEGQRKTLRTLIDSSPLPIITTDLNQHIQEWNPACERVFGWSKAEVFGQELPYVPQELRKSSRELLKKILTEDMKLETEALRKRKDGTIIFVKIYAICIKDEFDRPLGVMAILDDITTRKSAELDSLYAREEAEKTTRLKSEFLANMSHEIRTPLNGVIGMADLLLDTGLNDEQRKFASIIQNSGSALLTLINDILDFSKMEAGKFQLEKVEFSPVALVENQAEILIARAKEKNISLMTFIAPDVPRKLIGDPGRLGQVLLNLIGNAIKFTETGGVTVRMLAKFSSSDPTRSVLRIEIEDTGIGLSDQSISQLFTPFKQVDGSTARKYGGTGLGLSISKNLVECMGGTIGVTSKPSKGSTFYFEIPLVGEQTKINPSESYRILVLDQDDMVQDVFSRYLKSWNFEYFRATSLFEAIEVIEQARLQGHPIEVLMMGNSDDSSPLQAAEELRTQLRMVIPKLILLNEFGAKTSEKKAHACGFQGVLSKPIKQSPLFDCITQVMKGDNIFAGRHPEELIKRNELKPKIEARILVADDVAANQLLTVKILESLGYSAQAVANGAEAVLELERGQFDLVLMDCQMPEMDGYEATKRIRLLENEKLRNIPVIALTANAMSGDTEKCLAAGMNDYLTKPIKKELLGEMVGRWLERSRNQDSGPIANQA